MSRVWNTHFDSFYALAELPWFDVQNGRLVVDSPEVGPIIDTHTHLALNFVRKQAIDLVAEGPPAQHYLPLSQRIDLDLYANKNFSEGDLKRLKLDLSLGSLRKGGMRATHTAPNLLAEMAELGLTHSVLLAIDVPRISSNSELYLAVARQYPPLLPFVSVHPADSSAVDKLDQLAIHRPAGVKLHPAVQLFRPDSAGTIAVCRRAGELELPVLFHCGPVDIETRLGRYMSQVRHYNKVLRSCPETTFILGHSGALQMEQALALCCRYPNVYLEISCQGLPNLRKILATAPRERLMFGSDWPFYHQAFPLVKLLMATEDDRELRHAVLYDNAARLLRLPARDALPAR